MQGMASIRPAAPSDLAQIRTINTHYIQNTSLTTFARTPPPLDAYISKLSDLQSRDLPYIVAIHPTQKADENADLVLGYAYLSRFRENLVSYAPTVELSLFVHPDHQSQSIGSLLLGALLKEVSAGLIHRVSGEVGGEGVTVRNVIAVMSVDPEGKDEGEALRRWYLRRGFVERGRMVKVGFKRGHWIDTVYLQYTEPK